MSEQPDFEVNVQCELDETAVGMAIDPVLAQVETAVAATLRQKAIAPPAALTVLLTADDHIRRLNRDFRGEDKPTDVLSFPAGEPVPGYEEPVPYLGDIAISVPYARRQAQQQDHTVAEEVVLLSVHGTLHLLGHDHLDEAEKAEMWAVQTAVLQQLGLSHVTPTEA